MAAKQQALDIEGSAIRVGSRVMHLQTRTEHTVESLVSSDDLHRDYDPPVWYPVLKFGGDEPGLLDHIPVRPSRLLLVNY